MALKTFNVDPDVYKRFSGFCKGNGINMSKQVTLFMASFVEDDPATKKSIVAKLDRNKLADYAGGKDNSLATYEE
jgi:hypothetical protein